MEKDGENCLDFGLHNLFLTTKKELIIIDLGLMTYFEDNVSIVDCPPPEILVKATEEGGEGGKGKKEGGKGKNEKEGGGGKEGGGCRREEKGVWRMGVLFFEMLTGRKPWRSKSSEGYLNAIETIGVKLGENIEVGLRELIAKMLRKDVKSRIKWNEIAKYLKIQNQEKGKEEEGGWRRNWEEGRRREEKEGRSEMELEVERKEERVKEEGRSEGDGREEDVNWKISIFSMFCQEGNGSAKSLKQSLLKYPSLELDAKKGVNTKEFCLEAGEANQMSELQKILVNYKDLEGRRKTPFLGGKESSSDFFNLKENFGRIQIIKPKETLSFESKNRNELDEVIFGDNKVKHGDKQGWVNDSRKKEFDNKAFSNPFESKQKEAIPYESKPKAVIPFETQPKQAISFEYKPKEASLFESKPKEANLFETKSREAYSSQMKPNLPEFQKYPKLTDITIPSNKNEKLHGPEPKKRCEIQLDEKKEDNLKKIKVTSCFQGKLANLPNVSEEVEEKGLAESVNPVYQSRNVKESKLVEDKLKKESQFYEVMHSYTIIF